MNKSKRIIITIIAVIAFFALFAVVMSIKADAGSRTPGILGIGLLAGLYFGLKSIWKKPEEEFQEDEEYAEQEDEDER